MGTTKNTAGNASGATPEINLAGVASALHDRMAYDLLPALKLLQFALNTNRVLRDISDHAEIYPAFGNNVNLACRSWRDPLAADDANDILNDFARVVVGMAERLTADAGGLGSDLRRIDACTAKKGGA